MSVVRGIREAHRAFLQGLIAHGFVTEATCQVLYSTICQLCGEPEDDIKMFIQVLNENLAQTYMAIKHTVGELDGVVYFGLVNTRSDEFSKIGTFYTPNQVSYFIALIERIIDNKGKMGWASCLNVRDEKKMNLVETDSTLMSLAASGWLACEGDDRSTVCIGPRSFLELKDTIANMAGDSLVECIVCSEMIINGERCGRDKCPICMHVTCAKKWFGEHEHVCPQCSHPWPPPGSAAGRSASSRIARASTASVSSSSSSAPTTSGDRGSGSRNTSHRREGGPSKRDRDEGSSDGDHDEHQNQNDNNNNGHNHGDVEDEGYRRGDVGEGVHRRSSERPGAGGVGGRPSSRGRRVVHQDDDDEHDDEEEGVEEDDKGTRDDGAGVGGRGRAVANNSLRSLDEIDDPKERQRRRTVMKLYG